MTVAHKLMKMRPVELKFDQKSVAYHGKYEFEYEIC